MIEMDKFLKDVKELCEDYGLDFHQVSEELLEFIGSDEIVDCFIINGPFPALPETKFEIVLISNECVYDYEMREQRALQHLLPVKHITQIAESFDKKGRENYLTLHLRIPSFGFGLMFQAKLSDMSILRRLSSAVRNKVIESQRIDFTMRR